MAKKLSPAETMRNLAIGHWVARLIHEKGRAPSMIWRPPQVCSRSRSTEYFAPWQALASLQKPKVDGST
jgi:hypothetical protein